MTDHAFIDAVLDRISISTVINRSLPLKKRGREFVACCPFHTEKTGSFSVNDQKGLAHCFGCGWSGDAISWLQRYSGLSFRDALNTLAMEAGLSTQEAQSPTVAGRPQKKKPLVRGSESRVDNTARRIEWARQMWALSEPANSSLVSTYLRNRGLHLPPDLPTLKFIPDAWHSVAKVKLPAMVAAVQNPEGKICGVHRTFLAPNGHGKADVKPAKMAGGQVWGGAIRLCKAQPKMGIAEGIETALSVMQASGLPTWCAISLGNMAAIEMPPIVEELVLCVDADGDQDALKLNIDKAIAFHSARGLAVRIARPEAGSDFNDMMEKTT